MYSVYILQSLRDLRYYIGQTEDLEARINKHEKGRVKSTKYRLPIKLIRIEKYETRSEARKRENYLKSLKGGNEFKKIIKLI